MNTTDAFDPVRATIVKPTPVSQVDEVVSGVGHKQPMGAEQRVRERTQWRRRRMTRRTAKRLKLASVHGGASNLKEYAVYHFSNERMP